MGTITQSVDVDVDLRTAYNQWTQFETFPKFMEGVQEVKQLTDTKLHWVTKVGPVVREFDAIITEQHPDQSVAWKSIDGPEHAGRVTFHKVDDDTTEVIAEMTIDPEGFVENVGDKAGIIDARVRGDLMRFKSFIEDRGSETGAWRGEVNASGASAASAASIASAASTVEHDQYAMDDDLTLDDDTLPRSEPMNPDGSRAMFDEEPDSRF